MLRCIELAKLGAGHVAPNPMVGAVLVHNERIIGEGYHRRYGEAHAEINCLNSVNEENKNLIPKATLYVSLEPCVHHGKTPPCTDRIIQENIRKVVIGSLDPFEKVNGKGIDKLKNAGLEVWQGILEKQCKDLNKRFFIFNQKHRPYIILKWAQSNNAKISNEDHSRVFISNELTNRLVHQWRSEEASILIGTKTALFDDPELTLRLWKGKSPVRMVIDMNLNIPKSSKIFDNQSDTIIFNTVKQEKQGHLLFWQLAPGETVLHDLTQTIYQLNIQSVLVEGGAGLLQSFINEKIWDEARIITNSGLSINKGIPSPELGSSYTTHAETILNDRIQYYFPS